MYFDHIDHPIPQRLFPDLSPFINVIMRPLLDLNICFTLNTLTLQTKGNFSSENKKNRFFTLK